MTDEEKIKYILFQIDIQLYDEFNDKFCEINEHLGDIYTYKDLEDLKQAERDRERKLLREAIQKQAKVIDKMAKELDIAQDRYEYMGIDDIKQYFYRKVERR